MRIDSENYRCRSLCWALGGIPNQNYRGTATGDLDKDGAASATTSGVTGAVTGATSTATSAGTAAGSAAASTTSGITGSLGLLR